MKCRNPKHVLVYPKWAQFPIITEFDDHRLPGIEKGFWIDVPCGKCSQCLISKRNSWLPRLQSEFLNAENSYFVTMTYDDENLPMSSSGKPCFSYRDLQLAIKRLRKYTKKGLKYFAVCEYGGTYGRPHYHMILFNLKLNDKSHCKDYFELLTEDKRFWPHGFVSVSPLNGARITYTCKYILWSPDSSDIEDLSEKPFMVCSNGIGLSYLTPQRVRYHQSSFDTMVHVNGRYYKMPRYYRQKIFDTLELQEMLFWNGQLGLTSDFDDELEDDDLYDDVRNDILDYNLRKIKKAGKL